MALLATIRRLISRAGRSPHHAALTLLVVVLLTSGASPAQTATTPANQTATTDQGTSPQGQSPQGQPQQGQPQELDKVIAIVNGDVLLQSDVLEEMQFAALQPLSAPGVATEPAIAGRRLISRTLILQQMKSQQAVIPISDENLNKSLTELRRQIPACARFHCETAEGWQKFLQQNNLTEQQVAERWRQRLQIINFIDLRFRNGIRITKPEIQAYYDKAFVPAFKKEKANPPPLADVSSRIEEILLQQRVTGLLQDWLKSLRDQGSVQILDPIYGASSNGSDDNGAAA